MSAPLLRRMMLCLAAFALFGGAARAEVLVFKTGYTLSYLGMPLGRAEFTAKFGGDRFALKASLASSELSGYFDAVRAQMSASGRFQDGSVRPDKYVMVYKIAKQRRQTTILFGKDGRAEAETLPALNRRRNWVAPASDDLHEVADPLSATLLRTDRADAVCRRTIRFFDGELRADVALSPAGTEMWNGLQAVACNARFLPVSGYRRDGDAIAYLRDSSAISLVFAPLRGTGTYAPVRASIATGIGTFYIDASADDAMN